MLSLTLLLLACTALQTDDERPVDPAWVRPEPARVELSSGRASLVSSGKRVELRRGVSRQVIGQAHLELIGATRLRLVWGKRASLVLTGPCSIEWTERSGKGASPADLKIQFHRVGEAELEVRQGRHEINLPGDWQLSIGAGAMHFSACSEGPTEVTLHAGPPQPIHWLGDRRRPRPPIVLSGGTSCRLVEPPVSRPDRTSQAPAWETVSWPWARGVEDILQNRERQKLTRRLEEREAGFDPWPAPAPLPLKGDGASVDSVGLLPKPGEIKVIEYLEGDIPDDKAGLNERTQALLRRGAGPPVAQEDYQDYYWRGVRWEDLRWAGPVIVQTSSGVETTLLKGGRTKILLTSEAGHPIWVFGAEADMRIEPGGVLVFTPEGQLSGRFGGYISKPVVPGRPTAVEPTVIIGGPESGK